jgi:hypothetical protein
VALKLNKKILDIYIFTKPNFVYKSWKLLKFEYFYSVLIAWIIIAGMLVLSHFEKYFFEYKSSLDLIIPC